MGLGRLYLKTGDLKTAIKAFSGAIKIDPQYAPRTLPWEMPT